MSEKKYQVIEIVFEENYGFHNVKTSTLYDTQKDAEQVMKLLVDEGSSSKFNHEPTEASYGSFSMRGPCNVVTFMLNEVKPNNIGESIEFSDELVEWLKEKGFYFED